jgi:hypothetical protein
MNMEIIKKHKVSLLLVLMALVGVFFFFYHFYHKDVKTLADFSASYERFNKAISDFSLSKTDDLESKAGDALIELNTKSTFRLSSLIKNDAKLMDLALEVADLSGKEIDSLKVYKRAIQSENIDLDELAKEYSVLTSKRKAAYAHFRELAGLKD